MSFWIPGNSQAKVRIIFPDKLNEVRSIPELCAVRDEFLLSLGRVPS
jgi:hypothetical protein